jgi:hypothetical protein
MWMAVFGVAKIRRFAVKEEGEGHLLKLSELERDVQPKKGGLR